MGRCSHAEGHSVGENTLIRPSCQHLGHQPLPPRVHTHYLTKQRCRYSLWAVTRPARGTNLSRWWDYRVDVRPRHYQPDVLLTELGSSRWDSRKRGSQGTRQTLNCSRRPHPWHQDRGCATTQGRGESAATPLLQPPSLRCT